MPNVSWIPHSMMHRIELKQYDHRMPTLEELQKTVGGYIQPIYFEDDPLGYWHLGYVNEEGMRLRLPRNAGAEAVFARYEGLLGNVIIIENVGSWLYNSRTHKKVRLATKSEALDASQNPGKAIIEHGIELYIGEDDGDDDDSEEESSDDAE